MSWDTRWPLRWASLDRPRFEAAVRDTAAGFDLELHASDDRLTALVKLPRAFVERHDLKLDPLPPDDHFWAEIELAEYDGHPFADDGPYEPVVETLADSAGGQVYDVGSLCRHAGAVFAATGGEHTFMRVSTAFHELAWPEDYDGELPAVVGSDGNDAWACGRGVIFRVEAGDLVPIHRGGRERFRCIGGHRGQTYVLDDDGAVYKRDGERFALLDRKTIEGGVVALASNATATYVTAVGNLLVRIEHHGAFSIPMPDDIAELHEMTGIAVAPDGAVWLVGDAVVVRYADRTWTRFSLEVEKLFAIVIADGAPVVLGRTGAGARFDGSVWQPFRFAADGSLHSACVDPDETILVGGDSSVIRLEPRGPRRELVVRSNRSANREAWGAVGEIAERIAHRIGAGPAR